MSPHLTLITNYKNRSNKSSCCLFKYLLFIGYILKFVLNLEEYTNNKKKYTNHQNSPIQVTCVAFAAVMHIPWPNFLPDVGRRLVHRNVAMSAHLFWMDSIYIASYTDRKHLFDLLGFSLWTYWPPIYPFTAYSA